ncbi:hypothetical protein [Sulfobacillus thermotolerans]|uniref:hypothetical protein n=1 Tax=Sulfobacillus thermotolerans TaxID=338644 RepID=UPI0026950F95
MTQKLLSYPHIVHIIMHCEPFNPILIPSSPDINVGTVGLIAVSYAISQGGWSLL